MTPTRIDISSIKDFHRQVFRIDEKEALRGLSPRRGLASERGCSTYTDIAIAAEVYALFEDPPTDDDEFMIRTIFDRESGAWKARCHMVLGRDGILIGTRARIVQRGVVRGLFGEDQLESEAPDHDTS